MIRLIRFMDGLGELLPTYAAALGGTFLLCKLADIAAQAWFS